MGSVVENTFSQDLHSVPGSQQLPAAPAPGGYPFLAATIAYTHSHTSKSVVHMVVTTFNPSTEEASVGRCLCV